MSQNKRTKKAFQLVSPFQPQGDQPAAIEQLVQTIMDPKQKKSHQVLLGVTGSGKTFTMAHTIAQTQLPAVIIAPNKTLAAQLFIEFQQLFPYNAVEYFISYYDYYQPEAYVPSTDTFIEKDASINEQIDRLRHSATRSTLERTDVIVVCSVSCIYGLGSPEIYEDMKIKVKSNMEVEQKTLLRQLVRSQYQRVHKDFYRGTFRVRGDRVEIFPSHEEQLALRVDFFGDFIEKLSLFDSLTGQEKETLSQFTLYPSSHYVNKEEGRKRAIDSIRQELQEELQKLKSEMKLIEAQRLEQRTLYDIEIIEEMGFCSGIENYSRHFTGRPKGFPPPTLFEYLEGPFITFIDESHITVPQIGGMYRGDRARKLNLVEHGFRLSSALDNRPLNFSEFEGLLHKTVYVSATPGDYELEKGQGLIVEQLVRPTGLLDPQLEIRPTHHQVEDLLKEMRERIAHNERVLVTTLTKKSSEELCSYYEGLGLQVRYLHSDIKALERMEILRDLRQGIFHVLIGINLLREGLDIPEVSLVAIMDADKEGFLRSERSLIQTIGRAARNINGRVILYADKKTNSIQRAMEETNRRREKQAQHNRVHHIIPQSIQKDLPKSILETLAKSHYPQKTKGAKKARRAQNFLFSSSESSSSTFQQGSTKQIQREIRKLKKQMQKASFELNFEEAARLRDKILRLQMMELEVL